jgi:uncharacterized membrane protein YhhN
MSLSHLKLVLLLELINSKSIFSSFRHPELVSPLVTAFQDNERSLRVILKQVQDDERGDDKVMAKDLAHKRPWLLASLLFGISYPFSWQLDLAEPFAIAWKMAGVGLLTGYALRKHHTGEFLLLATVMAFWALGDGLLELDMIWGAVAFAAGHLVAIALFLRHRRVHPVFSQKLLAVAVFLLAPLIAYYLPAERSFGLQAAGYTAVIGAMAGCAWNSNFPRYRVGIGAMAFVTSDLLIFARMGALAEAGWVSYAIWYLYYGGVLMIATGVVTTLVKRGHYSED